MNDDLGDRMKDHENVFRQIMPKRQYYILRIDGKAFHTYTKGLERPFDQGMIEDMQETMKYLCENVQGAQFGYTQSDEITIVFTDLMKFNSDTWFGGNIQKITSIAASLATAKFNHLRARRGQEWFADNVKYMKDDNEIIKKQQEVFKLAHFDARVFPLSQRQEALNCLLWRQQDASKNSVQMLARSLFSHKECQGLNGSQLQDKMMLEMGINWNDIATTKKRGSTCYKIIKTVPVFGGNEGMVERSEWFIDNEIPIFSKDWTWFNGKII